MKMARISLVAVALCGVLLMPQFALAQEKDPADVDSFVGNGMGITIPDDAYDGTLASMLCFDTDVGSGTVTQVDVDLGVDHSWVGDLTVKVVSPAGTILTAMSRPGDALPDDGTDCCGDSSDMVNTSQINYADGNTSDAETMGGTIDGDQFVCLDDGECDFFANPDGGPGVAFSDFAGEDALGVWQVCVGDSASGDEGQLFSATANVSVGVPTTNRFGLLLLLALLAGSSILVLRRQATHD